jgi:aminomethyltransferase
MAKQTPLYATHVRLGGKLVDFAGWDMPLHYGSQVEEHHLVRRDAGMFDVSHMLAIDLDRRRRPRPAAQPHRQQRRQADRTRPALYSCMLNPQGGVIDDLIVYFFRPDFYRVVVNAGTADKDLAWITSMPGTLMVAAPRPRHDRRAGAERPRQVTWAALPGAEAASTKLKPFHAAWFGDEVADRPHRLHRRGRLRTDDSRRGAPKPPGMRCSDAGVKPAGLGARDTLRLEAGMNLYGQDMDEQTSPLEAGLAWTVDLEAKRDFIGKSVCAGRRTERQTLGLLLVDKGVLRAHQKVFAAQGEGEITSGTFSPTMGRSIALARLPAGCAVGDTVEVEIRDKRLKATVVKPPFVRNGKVLVHDN